MQWLLDKVPLRPSWSIELTNMGLHHNPQQFPMEGSPSSLFVIKENAY